MGLEYFGGPRILNGLTGETQTFAVGSSGTDFGISSSGSAHTFNIPDASASARGLVTTGTQTFAGAKTFSTSMSSPTLTLTTDSGSLPGLNFTYAANGGIIQNNGTRAFLFNGGGITVTQNMYVDNNIALTINGYMTGSSNVISVRGGTAAQTFRVYNTYTSGTTLELMQMRGVAAANFELGTMKGSVGGTVRGLTIGTYANESASITPWMQFTNTGNVVIGSGTPSSYKFDITGTATYTTSGRIRGAQYGSYPGFLVEDGAATNFGYMGGCCSWSGTSLYGETTGTYSMIFASIGAYPLAIGTNSKQRALFDSAGNITFTMGLRVTGAGTSFNVVGQASTGLTASTEATDVNFNLARTVQFANGAITTQRALRIQAPVYSHVSGSNTITTASTVSISGPPTTTGGFTTITNPYALHVESGVANFATSIQTPMITYPYPVMDISGYNGLLVRFCVSTSPNMVFNGSMEVGFSSGSPNYTGVDTAFRRSAASTLALRSSGALTSPHGFQISGTYTSSTNFELIQMRGVAAANFELGVMKGSVGGTLRGLTIGAYANESAAITPWLTFDNTGAVTVATRLGLGGAPNASTVFHSQSTTTRQFLFNRAEIGTSNTDGTYFSVDSGGQFTLWNQETSGGAIRFGAGNVEVLKLNTDKSCVGSGQLIHVPPTSSITLTTNGQFSVEMTSDTAGNLVYRGSDGTTRRCALVFV